MSILLEMTDIGLYSPQGDFFIDPHKGVHKAVLTHGHADHARWGSKYYLATKQSEYILKHRLGKDIHLQTMEYDKDITVNNVKLSFHPSGHLLGSAQIRLEYKGEVAVVSGDYKLEQDPTCEEFVPVKCHTFVTESTFGLPIYKWPDQNKVFKSINSWWKENALKSRTSLLFAYALGKAQRILASLNPAIGPIFTHGAVEKMNECYRNEGIKIPETVYTAKDINKHDYKGALVLAPPSADDPVWYKKFPGISRAFASGWMMIRGNRRRRSLDRGFVLSDHADWEGLLSAVKQTGAQNIWVTHGIQHPLVRYLKDTGYNAIPLSLPPNKENGAPQ